MSGELRSLELIAEVMEDVDMASRTPTGTLGILVYHLTAAGLPRTAAVLSRLHRRWWRLADERERLLQSLQVVAGQEHELRQLVRAEEARGEEVALAELEAARYEAADQGRTYIEAALTGE